MPEIRHLNNAPIIEALVDFRVSLPKESTIEQLSGLAAEVGDRYPIVETIHKFEASLTFEANAQKPVDAQTVPPTPAGFAFRSDDRRNVAQFTLDGFTYNRLHPYTSWEELEPEVVRLWRLYERFAAPQSCSRIATRYINRIEIPLPTELSQILMAPPKLPRGLPESLTAFITRVIIQEETNNCSASVTQASQAHLNPERATVILDIEAYRQDDLGLLHRNVEDSLRVLHDMKNRVFFGSLTDEQLKRYE